MCYCFLQVHITLWDIECLVLTNIILTNCYNFLLIIYDVLVGSQNVGDGNCFVIIIDFVVQYLMIFKLLFTSIDNFIQM